MVNDSLCFLIKVDYLQRDPWMRMEPANFPAYTKERLKGLLDSDATTSWTSLGCCYETVHLNARDWDGTLRRVDNVADFGYESVLEDFAKETGSLRTSYLR